MAQIDPSIALQARGVEDPLQSYGKAMTLKSLANQQRAQEAQFAQAEEERQATQRLNDLYRSNVGADGAVNRQGLLQGAASGGLGSRIPSLQKQFAEQDETTAKSAKLRSETTGVDLQNHAKGLEIIGTVAGRLASDPNVTHQDVISEFAALPANIIPPERTAQVIRQLKANPQDMRRQLLLFSQSAKDRLEALTPQLQAINLGGSTQLIDKNAITNPSAAGMALKQTASPESLLAAETARRGQNMADSRAKESNAAAMSKPFEVTGPDGTPVLVQQDKSGNLKPVDGFSPKATGKPSDKKAKVDDASDALSVINQAEALIGKATGSGIGSLVDRAQNVFGGTNEGAKAAAQLQALEGVLVSKMPKMSGPQSDKDVALYRQMAANIGDPKIPAAQKQAALDTVREIQERYAGVPKDASRPPVAPKPGATDGGYVYIGGDPASPSSWKKQ